MESIFWVRLEKWSELYYSIGCDSQNQIKESEYLRIQIYLSIKDEWRSGVEARFSKEEKGIANSGKKGF